MKMIEPLASRMPWMIGYGNHELLPHDSGNETGVATTARFATPSDSGVRLLVLVVVPHCSVHHGLYGLGLHTRFGTASVAAGQPSPV